MFLNFQNFTSQVLKKPKNLTSVSYKTVSYKNRMRVYLAQKLHYIAKFILMKTLLVGDPL